MWITWRAETLNLVLSLSMWLLDKGQDEKADGQKGAFMHAVRSSLAFQQKSKPLGCGHN